MNKPHKHAELIKAWADGAVIQYKDSGKWFDFVLNSRPLWDVTIEYRIKPEETDIEKYSIEVGDIWCLNGQCAFVVRISKSEYMEDGWEVGFNTNLNTSKVHLDRINAKLMFRRCVIERLNEM